MARLPRWGGGPGELAEWAAGTCDGLKDRGDEVYARIALSLVQCNFLDYFSEMQLDWERIKRGLATLLEKYDDSAYFANRASALAVLKLDREILQKTLPILGSNRSDGFVWNSSVDLDLWRKWLTTEVPSGQEEKLVLANPQGANCAGLMRDGKVLAVVGVGAGGYIRMFDTKTWEPKYYSSGLGEDFTVLACHPTKPILITGGGPIRPLAGDDKSKLSHGSEMWDLTSGQLQISAMTAHTAPIQALAFSADGEKLATGGSDRTARIWSLPKGLPVVLNQPSEVVGVCFSPDAKRLSVATSANGVLLWDLETHEQVANLPDSVRGYASNQSKTLAHSHAGNRLAYLNSEGRIVIYDYMTKKTIAILPRLSGDTLVVAFSPDDKSLATAGEVREVELFDTATGNALHAFEGHFDAVSNLCFLPDRKRLVSVSADATIRVWDISKFSGQTD